MIKFLLGIVVWFIFWIIIEYTLLTDINLNQIVYPERYTEQNIPSDDDNIETKYRIKIGKKLAKDKKIVICGLARDIKDKLNKNIKRLEDIGNSFKEYKIVIFENDSSDGTRELIKNWRDNNSNVILISCCYDGNCDCRLNRNSSYHNGTLSKERIERMAEFRNRYLDIVKKDYKDYDYMLVADLDLEGSCSIDGLLHSLTFLNDYDAISINGRFGIPGTLGLGTMAYDSLAYVSADSSDEDYNSEITHKDMVKKIIKMNYQINTTDINTITPVKSSFNGMAIYNIDSINSRYYPLLNCEHIGFHRNLKMGINRFWKGYAGYQGSRSFKEWIF